MKAPSGIREISQAAWRLLFPPFCPACDATHHAEDSLCRPCRTALTSVARNVCQRCGAPAPQYLVAGAGCPRCRGQTFVFEQVFALGDYAGPLRRAVIKMKHPVGDLLALALVDALASRIPPTPPINAVVPVPMYWTRRLLRGVNSPEVLAEALGRRLGAPVCVDLLRYRRKIVQQSTLAPRERKRNVREAFRVSPSWKIAGASILLVDDILTTGATANACAKALLAAGAANIRVAVVARGGAAG